MVTKKIGEAGNRRRLYNHLKMFTRKRKQNNYSKVKLVNKDGDTIDEEREVKNIIEKFWGILFCVSEKANYGTMKEHADEGMKNEVWNISEQELRRAIKIMKENKATDESGMAAE